MASPDVIDLARLLAPILGDNPAGEDLRQDGSPTSVYYQLKDARSAARASERQQAQQAGEEEGDSEAPPGVPPMAREWRVVLELAPGVLAERAKDLEVAAWLTEALLREHGFAGLRDGFRLIAGLAREFWDGLYPLEDEEGIETKLAPILGLNGTDAEGTLIYPIRNAPITAGLNLGPFAAWHYDTAHRGGGAVTREQFETSVRETPAEFHRVLSEDIEAALAALDEIDAAFTERCGRDAPSVSRIREALTHVGDVVRSFGRTEPQQDAGAAPAASEAAEPSPAARSTAAAAAVPGEIRSRDDAFAALSRVADFFRRTEPHSPLSYTLEELVRRGRMPLPELLRQLIPDDDARRLFMLRAGIAPPEEES